MPGFGKLPLSFEINKGQTDPAVKFLSRAPGYELFLTATDAILMLRNPRRREIKGQYVINGNEIRFKVEAFDSGKPLVIDPMLSYATFLGGAYGDEALGVAVDSQGNAYVTGKAALSFGFPTARNCFN